MKKVLADGVGSFMRRFAGCRGGRRLPNRRPGVPPEQASPFFPCSTAVDAKLAHVSALRCTAGVSPNLCVGYALTCGSVSAPAAAVGTLLMR